MRRGKHLGVYPVEEQRDGGLSLEESSYDSRKLSRRVEEVLLANHAPLVQSSHGTVSKSGWRKRGRHLLGRSRTNQIAGYLSQVDW